uniref:Tumor necrosis factor receptor superfamily member 19L n=1 Tax=Knipowitschia caucasica TaxID=637954 RepID=A0AAV2IYC6_KNICA
MMKNRLGCSALVLLTVFGCGGAAAVQCRWGEGCICLQCPPGQQPSKACAEIQSPVEDVSCRACPAGTFSDALDSELCHPHLSCHLIGRSVGAVGSVSSDAQCGDCLPGLFSTEASNHSPCVEKPTHLRPVRTVAKAALTGSGGPVNGTVVRSAEEKTAEYAVFALVPIFCVMGLLGILICNILKKKGYNCTAEKEGGDAEMASPQKDGNTGPYISDDILNEDTISVLVRLITEKKGKGDVSVIRVSLEEQERGTGEPPRHGPKPCFHDR